MPPEFLRSFGITQGERMEKKWMTVKEVAAYLQISKDLIYKWAQEGKIPVSKLGNQWRFNREEIDEWAKSQRPTREVDMVVHGHQHQPFTGAIMRSQGGKKFKAGRALIVNAAGSAGVGREHIPSGNNFYTIYNFLPSGIEIRLRMKSDADVGFKEAEGWGSELEGNPFGGMILKSES